MAEILQTIKVDSSEFEAYLEKVREYNAILKQNNALLAGAPSPAASDKNSQERVEAQKKLLSLTQSLTVAHDKGNVSERERNRLLREQEQLLRQNATHQSGIINRALSFSRTTVGKVGLLGMSIVGAGAAVSTLFNMAHKIAQKGSDIRTSSRILGTNPGGLQAWHAAFGPYGGMEEALATASQAREDIRLRALLRSIGVNQNTLESGNTTAIGREELVALRSFGQRFKGNALPLLDKRGLGALAPVMLNVLGLSKENFESLLKKDTRWEKDTNISDTVLRADNDAEQEHNHRDALRTKEVLTATAGSIAKMNEVADVAAEKFDNAAMTFLGAVNKFAEDLPDFSKLTSLLSKLGAPGSSEGGSMLGLAGDGVLALGGLLVAKKAGGSALRLGLKGAGKVTRGFGKSALKGAARLGVKTGEKLATKSLGKMLTKWGTRAVAGQAIGSDVPIAGNLAMGALTAADIADDIMFDGAGKHWLWDKAKAGWHSLTGGSSPSSTDEKANNEDQAFNSATALQLLFPMAQRISLPSITQLVLPYGVEGPSLGGASSLTKGLATNANDNAPLPSHVNLDLLEGAMAMQESHGDPHAMNHRSGAKGLLQLMDATAHANGVMDSFDPLQSWRGAREEISRLLRHYHGDIEKTEAAYNWGEGNLDRNIAQQGAQWRNTLPSETQNYLAAIRHNILTKNIVKIENYTGNNVSISTRQIAL